MNLRLRIVLPTIAAIAILLVVLPCVPAAGDQLVRPVKAAVIPFSDIVVIVDPVGEDGEPFVSVVGNAAQLKLEAAGLKTEVDSVAPSQDVDPLPRAQQSGAGAVLVCSYRVDGREMDVTLGWYDPATQSAAASAQARGDLDLHLDSVIFGALDDLLGKVQDKVQALAARRAAFPQPPGGGQPPGAPLQPVHPGGAPAGSGGTRESRAVRLVMAGGFAPFVPAGAASAYFNLGYLPSLLVAVQLSAGSGWLGVGLYTGLDYFAADGLVDSSINYLVPIGVDFRYQLQFGILRPFVHFTGGPALLMMQTGLQGSFLDVLPFLKSGIGLDVGITSWLDVSVVLDYDVYFEMPYLLMGFSPTMSVGVRI